MQEEKLNKAVLIPLIAAIANIVKIYTGYELPLEYADIIANGLLWAITFIAPFIHPKKRVTIVEKGVALDVTEHQIADELRA